MKFEYNTQLGPILIREYGRNVQRMVKHTMTIEDRETRTIAAKDIIKVMSQINPDLQKSNDYQHKLWDHLYIMSDYKLDVDTEFEAPDPEKAKKRPDLPSYGNGRLEFKHYGKTVEKMIAIAEKEEDPETKQKMAEYTAAYMKHAYKSWNEEKVADDVIIGNLKELSGGNLSVDSVARILDDSQLQRPPKQMGNKGKSNNKKKKRKPSNKRRY